MTGNQNSQNSEIFFDSDMCDVSIVQPELGFQHGKIELLERKLLTDEQELDVLNEIIFIERCRHGIIPLTHVHYASV